MPGKSKVFKLANIGEPLPDAVMQRAIDEASNADVLLVVGTSAAVYPAAELIPVTAERGAFVIVIEWVDIVFVIEKSHRNKVAKKFKVLLKNTP